MNTRPCLVTYAHRWQLGRCRKAHRVRAELALGRPLPRGAQVHHVGAITDRNARLVICQDAGYHMLLHARARVWAAGGDPNRDKVCSACRTAKPRTEFSNGAHRCKPCAVQHTAHMRRFHHGR